MFIIVQALLDLNLGNSGSSELGFCAKTITTFQVLMLLFSFCFLFLFLFFFILFYIIFQKKCFFFIIQLLICFLFIYFHFITTCIIVIFNFPLFFWQFLPYMYKQQRSGFILQTLSDPKIHEYICQLSRIMHESHTCGLKTLISHINHNSSCQSHKSRQIKNILFLYT